MSLRNRQQLTLVLALITVVFLGLGIFLALRSQQEDLPVAGECYGNTCAFNEICCAGCIKDCKPNTRTCNDWIQAECGEDECSGDGQLCNTKPQGCCSGLICCPNGRCGTSCIAPSTPRTTNTTTTGSPPDRPCSSLGGVCKTPGCDTDEIQENDGYCATTPNGPAVCCMPMTAQGLGETCSAQDQCASGLTCTTCQPGTVEYPDSVCTNSSTTTTDLVNFCGGYKTGNPGNCESGSWNIYKCTGVDACTDAGSGCSDFFGTATGTSPPSLSSYITGECQVVQADCVGSSPLIFSSIVNCNYAQCYNQTTTTTTNTSSSSGFTTSTTSSSNGGTTSTIVSSSSGGSTSTRTTVPQVCIELQRGGPENAAPAQTYNPILIYTSPAPLSGVTVVIIDSGNNVIAGPVAATVSGTGYTRTYTFGTITIPSGTPNGTYQMRAQINGVNIESPAACTQSLVINSSSPLEPSFSVIKSSAHVCLDDGGLQIDYVITVTNTSATAGTLDFVRDDLPVEVASTSQIQNINPAATTVTADYIIWSGPFNLSAGQSLQYHYRLTFTSAQMLSGFTTDNQADNTATIQYDTPSSNDNILRFILSTLISCLPDTALFDNPFEIIVLGIFLIVLGVTVNRTPLMAKLFGREASSTDAGDIINQILPESLSPGFENRIMKSREKKRRHQKKNISH